MELQNIKSMNYFTDTIGLELALKLQGAGMPCRIDYDNDRTDATFAEALDWLISRDIIITIRAVYMLNGELGGWQPHYNHWGLKKCNTWHEAAIKAIEKALEIIKEK